MNDARTEQAVRLAAFKTVLTAVITHVSDPEGNLTAEAATENLQSLKDLTSNILETSDTEAEITRRGEVMQEIEQIFGSIRFEA